MGVLGRNVSLSEEGSSISLAGRFRLTKSFVLCYSDFVSATIVLIFFI